MPAGRVKPAAKPFWAVAAGAKAKPAKNGIRSNTFFMCGACFWGKETERWRVGHLKFKRYGVPDK